MLNLHSHLPALIAGTTLLIVLVVWFVPKLQAKYSPGVNPDNFFDRENNARKNLAQIIGGVFLLAGLYSSIKTFDLQRQSARLLQEGQITDRFSKAIDQLGSVSAAGGTDRYGRPNINLEMRLGGIYALERIASDSPRDHWTIMEVLMTYVRENSPAAHAAHPTPAAKTQEADAGPPHPRTDIQAILTVIGRRDTALDPPNRQLDLSASDLAGASLKEATLRNALFIKSDLSGTDLMDANLKSADLENASLEGASLVAADLGGANLHGANLKGADLSGADLSGAIVAADQLAAASGDADTKLPASIPHPASWSH